MEKEWRRFLSLAVALMTGIGITGSMIPFISAWKPNFTKLTEYSLLEVDLSALSPGESMVVAWQNKPVWIIRRTQAMLDTLSHIHSLLRDPNSSTQQQPDYLKNEYRALNPEYFVVIGLCTHLGCSPQYKPQPGELNSTWPGGFYCPCHGSLFDLSGRVMKGAPAPFNLKVPPYRFINAHTILLGENPKIR